MGRGDRPRDPTTEGWSGELSVGRAAGRAPVRSLPRAEGGISELNATLPLLLVMVAAEHFTSPRLLPRNASSAEATNQFAVRVRK